MTIEGLLEILIERHACYNEDICDVLHRMDYVEGTNTIYTHHAYDTALAKRNEVAEIIALIKRNHNATNHDSH